MPGGHSDRWYAMIRMDHGLPDRKSRPRIKDKRWLCLGQTDVSSPSCTIHATIFELRMDHPVPGSGGAYSARGKFSLGLSLVTLLSSCSDAKRVQNIGRIFTHMGSLILLGRSTSVVQDTGSTSESHTFQYTSTTHAFT